PEDLFFVSPHRGWCCRRVENERGAVNEGVSRPVAGRDLLAGHGAVPAGCWVFLRVPFDALDVVGFGGFADVVVDVVGAHLDRGHRRFDGAGWKRGRFHPSACPAEQIAWLVWGTHQRPRGPPAPALS